MRFIDIPEDGFAAVLEELRASPIVASVDIDRERSVEATPDDTAYPEQWALPKIGWDQLYGSVAPANSATVAILDTGVDATHPDLDDVLVPGTSVLAGSHWSSDPNGHGTWMAGIVAAEANNAYGMAGVAYAGVGVMPVVVLGADGTGQDTRHHRGSRLRSRSRRGRHPHGLQQSGLLAGAAGRNGLRVGARCRRSSPLPATTAPVLRRTRRGTGG